jgi:hypothetical protein
MTGGLAFLAIAVVVSVVGTLVLWARNRDATTLDHGVDEFRREMDALSPDRQADDRRRPRG